MKKFAVGLILGCLIGLIFGIIIGGTANKVLVEGHDAPYWHQRFLDDREELLLWRDICHMYYQFKDYEDLDENWEPVRRYTFWEDAIMDTQTFDQLDSIQGGDWEDFYAEW
jgi:hypothetical protein